MKKIAIIATVPFALRVYIALHIFALNKKYNIVVFCNFSTDSCVDLFGPNVELVHIPFVRKIDLLKDIKALIMLYRELSKRDFDAIHSLMPKSGLLAMLAGFCARVPQRIHLFTGQVWATESGLKRFVLKSMDKVNVCFSTDILVDSPSQRDFLISENVVKDARVLGIGSVCGVDIQRFKRSEVWRSDVRSELSISEDAFVLGFVGRLTRDKGIVDLVAAFANIDTERDTYLVVVGPDEEDIKLLIEREYPSLTLKIRFIGHTDNPEIYMNAFDLFCLPSYREGFGSTVIEAAACGVPALVSRIYGLTDAVQEGVTGKFHSPGSCSDILANINYFIENEDVRSVMGQAAFSRCLEQFSSERLTNEMMQFYLEKFAEPSDVTAQTDSTA